MIQKIFTSSLEKAKHKAKLPTRRKNRDVRLATTNQQHEETKA
jgi:hypothetical protein